MKISFNWIKKYVYPINFYEKKFFEILSNIGLTIKNYEKIYDKDNKKDFILNIEFTPNRHDIMSHYGIARDIYAFLKFNNYNISIKELKLYKNSYKTCIKNNVSIFLEEKLKKNNFFIRYTGASILNLKIDSSPYWLTHSLKSIGINSVNNIIDIINYTISELGVPIHLFDLDKIIENKIFIKNLNKKNNFLTENNNLIKLDENEIIISDKQEILSLGGVLNNGKYGCIDKNTNNIFIGIICIDPSYIYLIRKKYLFNTKSQFLLEKEIDPNKTIYVLNRLFFLIKKIMKINCEISKIIDIYPNRLKPIIIKLNYDKISKIIGEKIKKKDIKKILLLLKVYINKEEKNYLLVSIPTCRTDIKREIDLIEEILRIYGISNIKGIDNINYVPINYNLCTTENEIQKIISEQLTYYGFKEIISSTIRNYNEKELFELNKLNRKIIKIINSNIDIYNNKILRPTMLFSMVDCIIYNYNHNRHLIKDNGIKLFEIGKIYYNNNNCYIESKKLILSVSEIQKNYKILDFFYLKGIIEQIFKRIGINDYIQKNLEHSFLENCLSILYKKKLLVIIGKIKNIYTNNYEIFYSEWDWEYIISIIINNKIIYKPISKYPIIKRDISFIIDDNISFEELNNFIKNEKNEIIKNIYIYDLYRGKNIPISKKSYTISFYFESKKTTLTKNFIDTYMKKIEIILKKRFLIEIRNKKLI
ncbi:phenylalanine--tRNA ligase beta subunit-related protein [Blattabacterium cuenoti]|uniref:phenylalanine--tRNA ligase beta subunit-related protein n=1 Tax=Blattabacterium cuenoti TaxID=1653831 RepID=UPI00163B6E55|nr:phenylalanine--tRNA ligase beta subunit-related protein [Blattabacterium cuenoti]